MITIYETKYIKDVKDYLQIYKKIRKNLQILLIKRDQDLKIKNAIRHVDNIITYLALHQNMTIKSIFKYVYLLLKLEFKNRKIIRILSEIK